MPCLEVGTVGGGTILPAQNACLQVCIPYQNSDIDFVVVTPGDTILCQFLSVVTQSV